VAETLQTQKGWRRAYQVLTLVGVVPDPPGVEEVATGRFQLLRWHWGTPMPLDRLWSDTNMPVCGREGGGGVVAKGPVVITGTG
jgi:hypothetical protein